MHVYDIECTEDLSCAPEILLVNTIPLLNLLLPANSNSSKTPII